MNITQETSGKIEKISPVYYQHLIQGIESIKDYAIFLLDPNGYVLTWNAGAEQIKGYTAEEIIGQHFSKFYDSENIKRNFPQTELMIAKEKGRFEDEGWRVRKDGSKFWANVVITAVYDNHHILVGYTKVTRDLTYRQQEDALRLSEERYRTLVKAVHSVVWTVNKDGAFVEPQLSWEAFTGQSWEAYKDFGWINALHPDDRETLLKNWQQAAQTLSVYQSAPRLWCHETQSYHYVIVRAAPLLDNQGRIREWIGSCIDIMSLKKTEQALETVTNQLNLALTAAQIGIWCWDLENNDLKVDTRIGKLFGLTEDYEIKCYKDFHDKVYGEDKLLVEQALQASIKQHVPYEMEYRIVWPDQSIHVIAARGHFYTDKDTGKPKQMIGVCWDITKRKHAEEWIRQHQVELTQVAQANTMVEMASSLSHELNQPLTVISTYNQLCLQQLKSGQYDKDRLLANIQEAVAEAERAGAILHRIKEMVKKRKLYLESIDVHQLIHATIKLLKYEMLNFPLNIKLDLASAPIALKVDKIQFQRVLLNLLRNSLEAMRDAQTNQPAITICTQTDNSKGKFIININDNGPGIPADIILKITEPYFTTKPYGMGMGLAICRTIIQAHGGQLCYAKSPLNGASLQIILPMTLNDNDANY